MNEKTIREIINQIGVFIAVYAMLCVAASAAKTGSDSCGNTYGVEYAVYSNLFCEVDQGDTQ